MHSEYSAADRMMDLSGQLEQTYKGELDCLQSSLAPYQREAYLENFFTELEKIRSSKVVRSAMLGLIGEMSSGKSTLVNMMIGYPLFPAAEVCTSACPVEICYGDKLSLEVFTYDRKSGLSESDDAKPAEKSVYFYEEGEPLLQEQMNALRNYVTNLTREGVLLCENLSYYHSVEDITAGSLQIDPANAVQVAQLLIVPLTGYIGEDSSSLTRENEALIAQRSDLLQSIFGLPPKTPFRVRIRIKSDLLKNGLTLVDLPGLGADAVLHTEITTDYLSRANCYVLLFGTGGQVREQNTALKNMADYAAMKSTGKNARFIAAINKCDLPFEKKKKTYGSVITSAVRQIRPQVEAIELAEILPVSAFYAEVRLLENGVALDHTVQWEQLSEEDMTAEEIVEKMQEQYHQKFTYTDPITLQEISSSTADFIEGTIGQYAARIRLLNVYDELQRISQTYQIALSSMKVQASMLRLLQECGDELMMDLVKGIKSAFREAQSVLMDELDKSKVKMDEKQRELDKQMDDVTGSYKRKLQQADSDINAYLEKKINDMEKDAFGHYIIDGKDDRSRANEALYQEIVNYFKKFNFTSYLSEGNKLLKSQLDKQRKSYQDSVGAYQKCFQFMYASCESSLMAAYKSFEEKLDGTGVPENMRKIYRECFDNTVKAIKNHLLLLEMQMNGEVERRDDVYTEIDKTADKVRTFFDSWKAYYHTHCVNYLIGRKGTTFWNDRPILDVKKIKAEIRMPFTTEQHRENYVNGLPKLFRNPAKNDSHVTRVTRTMDKISSWLESEYVCRCDQFFPTIDASIKNLLGASKPEIMAKYLHLRTIASKLSASLDGLENTGSYQSTARFARNYTWAEPVLASVEQIFKDVLKEFADFHQEMSRAADAAAGAN